MPPSRQRFAPLLARTRVVVRELAVLSQPLEHRRLARHPLVAAGGKQAKTRSNPLTDQISLLLIEAYRARHVTRAQPCWWP